MSFSAGFARGAQIGDLLAQNFIDRRANKDLEALSDLEVIEIEAPEVATGLGGEAASGKEYVKRYQFGDKTYSSAPPSYEVEYARAQRRAELLRKKGNDSLAEQTLREAREAYKLGGQEYHDSLARRAETLYYDDLGAPRPMEQLLGDEQLRTQWVDLLNDYGFEDIRDANGNLIRVEGLTPTQDGRLALDLVVFDPKTGEVKSRGPATQGRSSEGSDPVVLFTPEQAFSGMLDHLRGRSAKFADIDNQGRLYRGRRGLIEGMLGAESHASVSYVPSTRAQPQGLGGERPDAPDVAEDPSALDFSVLQNAPAVSERSVPESVVPEERQGTRTGRSLREAAPVHMPDDVVPRERQGTRTGRSLREAAPTPMPEEVVPRERQGVRSGRGSRSALGSEPSAEPQRQAPVSGAWSPNLDWKPGSAIRTKEDAQGAAVYHATRAGLPPELFLSLVQQESGWNPTARSNKGAWGLGQIMPETARQPGFGVTPVRNNTPEENLRFSADYLKAMLARYDGNVPLALAAYNAGAGAVDKAGGIPNFRETQNYVRTILGQAGGGSPERGNSRAVGASRQGSPRGLDAAIRMATHFPNEVSVKDAERYANTGRLAEPQYLRDSKGGGAAVDPYNGRSLWERAATETPMTAAEQAETRLKLEEQQYKLAQQRMKTIEQVGKHAFGDDFTPQVGAMMAITMDARGIEPTQKNLSTVMHHAKRTTEAVQEKMKPLIGRGPTFRSYSVGMAAGALGLTETEAGEVVDRLVKPMQSIVGGENISEETQLHLMIGLGTVQERAGVTPAESAQMIQMAMRYGFKVSDLLQHIEQAKEQGVELTPSRYEHVLAQQTGRRHAQ